MKLLIVLALGCFASKSRTQSLPMACDRWPGLPCGPPIGGCPGVKPLWKGGLLLVEPAGDGNTLSRGRRQHLVG